MFFEDIQYNNTILELLLTPQTPRLGSRIQSFTETEDALAPMPSQISCVIADKDHNGQHKEHLIMARNLIATQRS